MGGLEDLEREVLPRRYRRRDGTGEVVERIDDRFRRVADDLAAAEPRVGPRDRGGPRAGRSPEGGGYRRGRVRARARGPVA